MNPTVSFIIPCYKQAHFLRQAVDSALGQSAVAVEVLVVDDGSPDDTPQVAKAYGARIRYIRKANAGLSAARNTGILAATGEFLIFLDADDYLPADAVASHLQTARDQPNAAVFYAEGYFYVDDSGRRFGSPFEPLLPEDVFHQYLLGNIFPPHAAMTRRSALADTGLFDVGLRSLEDWDMWLRLAAAGAKFARTAGLAVPYRQHPQSMSKNFERMRQSGLAVLRKARSYHPGCAICRKAIASGRWNIRSCFVKNTRKQLAGSDGVRREVGGALVGLARAACRDPLLAGVGVRNGLRGLKWKFIHRPAD